jgi:hypothetical protein
MKNGGTRSMLSAVFDAATRYGFAGADFFADGAGATSQKVGSLSIHSCGG